MRATRLAIGLFFFGDGLMIGSWAGRIPAVQHHAGLTTARLGLALFAASLGALVAMPVAGRLCERVGSRSITLAGLLLGGGSLFAASLSTGLVGLSAALFGFGAGFGTINVAVNAQGVALEQVAGRSILSSFHAAFSAGGLVGAGHGRSRRRSRRSASSCTTPCWRLVLTVFGVRRRPRTCFRPRPTTGSTSGQAQRVRAAAAGDHRARRGGVLHDARRGRRRRLERRLPVAVVRSRGRRRGARVHRLRVHDDDEPRESATASTAGSAPVTLARSGAAVATIGLGLALVIGSVPVAIAGFAAMGAGLGVVVPVLFRAAASTQAVSASVGLATVSTIGWFGFLAGPPAIGFAASAVGLRAALGIVVLATLTLVALAGNAEPGRREQRVAAVRWRTDP